MKATKKPTLRRAITLPHAIAMVVGTIIGASIFVQPSEITGRVPSIPGILLVWVVAAAPRDRVDLIRSSAVAESVVADGRMVFELRRSLRDLRPGEYLYVRAVQRDEGAVWSSPYWFE